MADNYSSTILKLPNSIVTKSVGFALDIGCSAAKLVYRSKEDYENGRPKKEVLKGETGQVHIVKAISRSCMDDVIRLIKERADITRTEGETTVVRVTGAGCSQMKQELEEQLSVKFSIEMENFGLLRAFKYLTESQSADELFYPEDDKTWQRAMEELKFLEGVEKVVGDQMLKVHPYMASDLEPRGDTLYPALLGLCGSGTAFMRVSDDSEKTPVRAIAALGGRPFLGLTALLTGKRDFAEIMRLVGQADGRTCNQYVDDVLQVGPQPPPQQASDGEAGAADAAAASANVGDASDAATGGGGGDDAYLGLGRPPGDLPMIYFGKAVEAAREDVKEEDVLVSLYRLFCVQIAQLAQVAAAKDEIREICFAGNFIDTEEARYCIKRETLKWNGLQPKEERVRARFVRNGGHLGAIGVFMAQ